MCQWNSDHEIWGAVPVIMEAGWPIFRLSNRNFGYFACYERLFRQDSGGPLLHASNHLSVKTEYRHPRMVEAPIALISQEKIEEE
jgi:hypothetical protein